MQIAAAKEASVLAESSRIRKNKPVITSRAPVMDITVRIVRILLVHDF